MEPRPKLNLAKSVVIFKIFFKDDSRLEFSKFSIFTGRCGLEGQDALLCQILSKLFKRFLRYHDFLFFNSLWGYCILFFKMAAVAILDFKNSQLLLAVRVRRAEMYHPSICCRVIVIFRFLPRDAL